MMNFRENRTRRGLLNCLKGMGNHFLMFRIESKR